jgi:fungal STAND N-terminal Goodbye domain
MNSTTSTTTSSSNFRLIIDAALDEYTKQTGIDLIRNPFAHKIQHSDSPESVLELFQERAKEFKEYRDGNRKLIDVLKPAVQILHALSDTLSEAVTLVSSTTFIPSFQFL